MWKFGGIEIERSRVGRICKLNFTLRPNVELPAWRILWTGHLPLVLLYQAGPSSIPISPLEDEISPSSRSSRHPCCCPEAWWWWQTRWQTWWQTQPLLWWGELSPSTISTTYLLSADHNKYIFFHGQTNIILDNLRGDQRALMAPDPSVHQGASAVLLLASEYLVVRFHKTLAPIEMGTRLFNSHSTHHILYSSSHFLLKKKCPAIDHMNKLASWLWAITLYCFKIVLSSDGSSPLCSDGSAPQKPERPGPCSDGRFPFFSIDNSKFILARFGLVILMWLVLVWKVWFSRLIW